MRHVLEASGDPAWVIGSDGYDPLHESSLESRFAISNGFLGVRGGRAITRGARWVVPARTYVAGLFDTPGTGYIVRELVPAADWLQVHILLSGKSLVHHPGDVSSHRMTLDMRRGALLTNGYYSNASGLDVRFRALRLVSLSDRSVGLQLIQFEIENGTADVTFEASFEGKDLGLIPERIDHDLGVWHTQHSGKRLAMTTASSLRVDGRDLPPIEVGQLTSSWSWKAHPGQSVCFERMVAIVRGDLATPNPGMIARQNLDQVRQVGWRGVVAAHEACWTHRWHSSDVEIEGDPAAQIALRFALYHLNSAANPADEQVSIGARALTGDDYHGHVFWDTEIYLIPFYVFTWPEAARTLLMYRFHTLDAARKKAAGMGWRGALYAWESADTGEEATPERVIAPDHRVVDVLCGRQEQHISADVAYAVWQYWQATGDDQFLCDAGAEIILETARFWASRAQLENDGLRHIRGVIGPDEYHQTIDDNAFTNVMARWNIRRALDVVASLRRRWPACWTRLSLRLALDDAELEQWRTVADTIVTGFNIKTSLFEQFEGYFGLEDIDLSHYAGRSVPIDMVIGSVRTQKSQVVKQPDVVALLSLLPDEFPPGAGSTNFRYYESRCDHGSSLSPALHGLVAARLGDTEMALRYFRQTAAIDLADDSTTTDGGVHIAALGGMWMLTVFGFAGVSVIDDGIAIDPHLPTGWHSLAFAIQWRHRRLRILISRRGQFLEATLGSGEPMTILVKGERHEVWPDLALRLSIEMP